MDKYEFNIKVEQIKKLIKKKDFITAVMIADGIDWERVRENQLLIMAADVYEIAGKYDDARDILLMAYERTGLGRQLAYRLCRLSVKRGDFEEADEFYQEFIMNSPRDAGKYILLYEIAKGKGEPVEKQIEILEAYIEEDLDDRWAYELAKLYHKARLSEKCVELCDTIILWFADGKYVEKALELKQRYVPLSESQRIKYEAQKSKKPEMSKKAAESLKAVQKSDTTSKTKAAPQSDVSKKEKEVTKVFPAIAVESTKEIPREALLQAEAAEEKNENLEKEIRTEEKPSALSLENEKQNGDILDEVHEADIDVNSIHVRDYSVNNKYDTVNLQRELAKSVSSLFDDAVDIFKPNAKKESVEEEHNPDDDQIEGQMNLEEVLAMFEAGEFQIHKDSQKAVEEMVELMDTDEIDEAEDIVAEEEPVEEADEEMPVQDAGAVDVLPVEEVIVEAADAVPVEEVIMEVADVAPVEETVMEAADAVPVEEVIMEATDEIPVEEAIMEVADAVFIEENVMEVVEADLYEDEIEELEDVEDIEYEQADDDYEFGYEEDDLEEYEEAEFDKIKPAGDEPDEIEELAHDEIKLEIEENDIIEETDIIKDEPAELEEELVEESDESEESDEPVEAYKEEPSEEEIIAEIIAHEISKDIFDEIEEELDAADTKGYVHEEEMQEKAFPEGAESIEKTGGMAKENQYITADEDSEEAESSMQENKPIMFDLKSDAAEDKILRATEQDREIEARIGLDAVMEAGFEAEENEDDMPEVEACDVGEIEDAESTDKENANEVIANEEDANEENANEVTADEAITGTNQEIYNEKPDVDEHMDDISDDDIADDDTAEILAALAKYEASEQEEAERTSVSEDSDVYAEELVAADEVHKEESAANSIHDRAKTAETKQSQLQHETKALTQSESAKEELKSFIARFAGVQGLDKQILKVMQNTLKVEKAPVKFIFVKGEVMSGKTTLAIEVLKLANKMMQRRDQKIAKIKAESINGKSIDILLSKLDGSDVLIEKVSDMDTDIFVEFIDKINAEGRERFVIFEDEKTLADAFLERVPQRYASFANILDIRQNKIKEWTEMAADYAKSKGYAFDEMGNLALSAKIDQLRALTLVVHKNHVEQLVDGAIKNYNKFSVSNMFRKLRDKNEDGLKILSEKDFMD